MLIRRLKDIEGTSLDVDWGNGTSRRLLTVADERGSTLTDTHVRPDTQTFLRYDHHLESCYCIDGDGYVEVGGAKHPIEPGTLYAPEKGEEHVLIAGPEGMRLICLFNPPLSGSENHRLIPGEPSGY